MDSSASTRPANWIEAPDVPDVPVHELIFNTVEENLKKYGDSVWLKLADTGKEIKFSEVIPKVKTVASALTRLGLKKGDFIIIYASSKIDYFILVFAVWMCGGAVSLMNPANLATTLTKVVIETEATFIACDSESVLRALEAQKQSTSVRALISLDDEEECSHCVSIAEMYKDDATACPTNVKLDSRNDIAYMPYSSGTTGLPKGVMHTFRSLTVLLHYLKNSGISNIKYQLRSFPYHVSGMYVYSLTLVTHLPVIGFEKYDDECFFRSIAKERPTHVYGFISNIVRIMKDLDLSQYDLSSIKALGVVGSNINPDCERQIRQRLPNVHLVQAYGLSEAFLVTRSECQPSDVVPKGTFGKPFVFCDMQVCDPQTMKPVPNGQIGELWIKSSVMMKGFFKNPEATNASIIDGWYRTGDAGYRDDEGYFFFVERMKELIKRDNYNIFPKRIEDIFHLHAAVADVAVVGQPHELYGEIPVAFVVKTPNVDITKDDMLTYINSRVAQQEKIADIIFIDSIPRNYMGKTLRRELLTKLEIAAD